MLPFAREQFIAVFSAYNGAVWPAQIVAYALGLGMICAVLRPSPVGDRLVGAGLALMWAWTGVAYHALFFAPINRAAPVFGALFVLQGLLFVHAGVVRRDIAFGRPRGVSEWLGWALVGYAAVLYPLLGIWTGHRYPETPMFGITPCPVTLFTWGLLLLTVAPVPRRLLAIPLTWSIVGGSAAFLLGVQQDWPLLVSGTSIVVLVLRDRRHLTSALS